MLFTLETSDWINFKTPEEQNTIIRKLEEGHILFLPNLSIELNSTERSLLTPNCLTGKSKNISFDVLKNELKGATDNSHIQTHLIKLMGRFILLSKHLMDSLLPYYKDTLEFGRTSYRPIEIQGRKSSIRKDDTRVHVDAFPATPTQGKRILRVFTNINPNGQDRVWNIGDSFEKVAQDILKYTKKPLPGLRHFLSLLKLTKTYRTHYDHLMLQIHDYMKMSDHYQNTLYKHEYRFPPGSTWIVLTDSVSHAALSGQYVLEQTFYLPWQKMRYPELSPLKILEKNMNMALL